MIKRAVDAFKRGEFLNEFIPVPGELKNTTAPNREDSSQSLREKYGYSDWYDFCCGEWGTKWDVGDDQGVSDYDDNSLTAYFDSAWSPPIAAYEKLEELGFKVYAKYYEGGCAFVGIYDEYGDDYYDLSGLSADEVASQIPGHLDEEFSISEMMREYEEPEPLTEWYKQGVKDTGLENE
jgi:hypothetical protein